MKFMWQHLFCTITLFCFVKNQKHFPLLNNHSREDIFDNILSEVLQTSRAKDAFLIFRDSLLNKQAHSILGKISAAIIKRIPTFYVNTDFTEPIIQLFLSRDLVLYIYVSEQEPDFIESKLIADDTRRFVYNYVRPKVLILMILHQSSRNLTTLFRAMWSRKILDTIIIEHSKAGYNEYSTIIHRYNPFSDSHTTEPYSADITWFTDNFPNMQGYPIVYAFMQRPPYSNIVPTLTGEDINGIDKIMSETLADKMNFSGVFKIFPKNMPFLDLVSNDTPYGIVLDINTGKYDALLTTVSRIRDKDVNNFRLYNQYSYPILIENWCIVVPKLHKKNFNGSAVIKLFLTSVSIVGIYWLSSRLMKFNPNRWHPLKIIGMILATSLPPVSTFRERLIFLSILAVSACYSSILFIEMTNTNLESNRYIEFNSLQDLIDSDLVLMLQYLFLKVTREHNEDFELYFRKYDKKILSIIDMSICIHDLLMYRNVSCLMSDSFAEVTAISNMQNGETTIMKTKLCYLSPPVGYMFPKESAYVKRITNIVLMLFEGGFTTKWYRDYLRNETQESSFQINQHTDFLYVSIFDLIIYILLTGYSISALVFIGELIWKYVNNNFNLC